jgi:hypothetical protein
MASKLMSLVDFLPEGDQTYMFTVPSQSKDVKLRRLTHGEVRGFNQDVADAGFRITDDIRDHIIAAGLVEPAMTVEDIQRAPGNRNVALDEIYQEIARECTFLMEKPPIYIPTDLDPIDAVILSRRFTVIKGTRPKADDDSPLSPDAEPNGSDS